jgi:hypothetical protein
MVRTKSFMDSYTVQVFVMGTLSVDEALAVNDWTNELAARIAVSSSLEDLLDKIAKAHDTKPETKAHVAVVVKGKAPQQSVWPVKEAPGVN